MNDVLFVEVRKFFDKSCVNFNVLNEIPSGSVSIGATVQYLNLLPLVKKELEKSGRKVFVQNGAYYDGHVIGCQSHAFNLDADNLLLLSDGMFHALNNSIAINREMFIFNGDSIFKITKKDLEKYFTEITLKKTKFLVNNKIGLLISNKIGQNSLSYNKVKNNIEKLGKKVYIFESDNINLKEFENFKCINIFVNTACFGLGLDDSRIINLLDIVEFFNSKKI